MGVFVDWVYNQQNIPDARPGDIRAERAQAIIPSDLGALFTGLSCQYQAV